MTSPIEKLPPLPPPRKFTEKDYWIARLVISWPLLLFGGSFWLLGYPLWVFGVIVGVFYMVMSTLYFKWYIWFLGNSEPFEICKLLGFLSSAENEAKRDRIKKAELISKRLYEGENIAKSPKSPMETLVLQGWIIVAVVLIGVVYLVGTRGMTEYNKGIESQYDINQREIDRVQSLLDQYQN